MTSEVTKRFEVFLAHSKGDKEYVRAIHQLLTLDGFYPWLDEVNLIAGQNWELEISNAVERAIVIAVFLSKSAISKEGYLHKEIAIALEVAQRQPEGSITIIPIRLDTVEPPRSLRHLQWIDVQHIDRPMFFEKLQYLIELDPMIESFMIGESYLSLRRALLHRAQQVGGFNFPATEPTDSLYFYKGGHWGHFYESYLIHGRNPNGNTYFGRTDINRHRERFEMCATIGTERHRYTGELIFPKLQFTGAHDVSYTPSGSGLLLGSWNKGGLEELIPALKATQHA
jgi:hypothetical protein